MIGFLDSASDAYIPPPSGGRLQGELIAPGDKSISHRALLIAALADGVSHIFGLSEGDDVKATASAVASLGASVYAPDGLSGEVEVRGGELRAAEDELDVGNSGTSIRLLAGVAAGQPFTTTLTGDASVRRRPMGRVTHPLRLMGARVAGPSDGSLAPLTITGGSLEGVVHEPPAASAQVKGALLLAGLFASGETVVVEAVPTRPHTEEMLAAFGADVRVEPGRVSVRASAPDPFEYRVPGDPSSAAFWATAAAILPGSDVILPGLYLGRTRDGFRRVLERMGARLEVSSSGVLRCRHGGLQGTTVAAEEIPDLIDEIPVLAVAAAVADGVTRFEGAGELRHKESDRLDALKRVLTALGADVDLDEDTLCVKGPARLRRASVSSGGDHRIAMASCVALLAATGEGGEVKGWGSVSTSYPSFLENLGRLWRR